ncbi:MAG: hypothetical protein OEZ16_10775 [Chromatiales bacterium]|nr:hypothetical protein [Chromatiales bacterium]
MKTPETTANNEIIASLKGGHTATRTSGGDLFNWAMYELSSARRVELTSGIDTSNLREQIVQILQEDLYEWRGDDLTI